MTFAPICRYADFTAALRRAGFTTGGANDEGIFSLCGSFGDGVRWHTGDPETDPWAWRIRAVQEEKDLAYGKFFFRKGGYITREWMPYFLAVRREGLTLSELYEDGAVSKMEKDIYELVCRSGRISLQQLKSLLQCRKSDASRFETALTRLQSRLFLTVCGETRKLSQRGEPYGWPVTVFCRVEDFFGDSLWAEACALDPRAAYDAIHRQVLALNPLAEEKAVQKFIRG